AGHASLQRHGICVCQRRQHWLDAFGDLVRDHSTTDAIHKSGRGLSRAPGRRASCPATTIVSGWQSFVVDNGAIHVTRCSAAGGVGSSLAAATSLELRQQVMDGTLSLEERQYLSLGGPDHGGLVGGPAAASSRALGAERACARRLRNLLPASSS